MIRLVILTNGVNSILIVETSNSGKKGDEKSLTKQDFWRKCVWNDISDMEEFIWKSLKNRVTKAVTESVANNGSMQNTENLTGRVSVFTQL